jgi:hypothetical protein
MAMLADDGVSMCEEMISGMNMGIENDMGEQRGMIADDDMILNHYVCAYVSMLANAGCRCDHGCGMNSGSIDRRSIEEFDSAGEGQVRIFEPKGSDGKLCEFRLDQDGGGAGRARARCILLISNEGKLTGCCVFKPRDTDNEGGRIAMKFGAEVIRK